MLAQADPTAKRRKVIRDIKSERFTRQARGDARGKRGTREMSAETNGEQERPGATPKRKRREA